MIPPPTRAQHDDLLATTSGSAACVVALFSGVPGRAGVLPAQLAAPGTLFGGLSVTAEAIVDLALTSRPTALCQGHPESRNRDACVSCRMQGRPVPPYRRLCLTWARGRAHRGTATYRYRRPLDKPTRTIRGRECRRSAGGFDVSFADVGRLERAVGGSGGRALVMCGELVNIARFGAVDGGVEMDDDRLEVGDLVE
jgi:hypothetical protein